jgi:hypothetical protein
MSETRATDSRTPVAGKNTVGRLFVLELSGGRIHSMNPDGSDRKVMRSARLARHSAVPPLGRPLLAHHRLPAQRPRLPVGQNVTSLIFTSLRLGSRA